MPTKATASPSAQPPRHHINVLGQLLKYIPRGIVDAAAREFGVDGKARAYSVWSHLAAMVFVQLAHAFSLNDVCDWLRLKRRPVAGFGVTPPARHARSVMAAFRRARPDRAVPAAPQTSFTSAEIYCGQLLGKSGRVPVFR